MLIFQSQDNEIFHQTSIFTPIKTHKDHQAQNIHYSAEPLC